MRLAFLCTSSIDDASPRGRWLPLARELARMGHEPHLVLLHHSFDALAQREEMLDGVRVVHVAQMHVRGLPGRRTYFGARELAAVAARATRALFDEAIRVRPDAIHVCKPQPMNGAAGWLAARRLACGLFADCDDYEAAANRATNAAQRAAIRFSEDLLPKRARGVTVNTRFLFERNVALGVAPARIVRVPNGADDCAQVSPSVSQAGNVVVYVGTLSNISHGVGLLLDAFALVLRAVPEAKLVIVGDGDDRDALRAQAERLDIARAIDWAGRVPGDQVRAHWARAMCSVDPVFDTPAMRGRSPLKIVESMAAGVPVVTGDVGDRREMLGEGIGPDAAAGVVVQPGHAQSLADGIVRVLSDAELRQRLSRGALDRAQHFRWHTLARDWARIYELR